MSYLKKIRFALAGCGHIAKKHAEAIKAIEDAELVAVCDSEPVALKTFVSKYGIKGYGLYQELLQDREVDVVTICAPSGLHAAMGIAAARAGKNVLVEKPVAITLEEADALIENCERAGVVLGVVHQNRFKPAITQLKSTVERGGFGKITHANATVRWNRNPNYYTLRPWGRLKNMGGGALMNQAIHNIDLLQWMMGKVVSVFGYTSSSLGLTEAEDTGTAVLKFENGALGVIEASTAIYPQNLEETLSIFGEKGTAIIGGTSIGEIKKWVFSDQELSVASIANQASTGSEPLHQCCVRDMVRAVRCREKPLVDGKEGRKVLEIISAIYQSGVSGQEIVLTPLEQ
ncbi:MAG: Gfo/Idh/MocA family oxidoreductase [Desulfotomaculaceae bacterium]|nr:Gfo/Idh/MocA family oxidoreductase [Desulfotomaculaceae bacterium]